MTNLKAGSVPTSGPVQRPRTYLILGAARWALNRRVVDPEPSLKGLPSAERSMFWYLWGLELVCGPCFKWAPKRLSSMHIHAGGCDVRPHFEQNQCTIKGPKTCTEQWSVQSAIKRPLKIIKTAYTEKGKKRREKKREGPQNGGKRSGRLDPCVSCYSSPAKCCGLEAPRQTSRPRNQETICNYTS